MWQGFTAAALAATVWLRRNRMSKINGEKARAAVAKRNRTARRAKDRARLAEIKAGGGKQTAPAKQAKNDK
jgi:hypothetical protein